MNIVMSVLYAEGYWLPSQLASRIGTVLRTYLLVYQQCAALALAERLNRFSLAPKFHMISHQAEELVQDSRRARWCINPLATSNQIQEDYIGRPSRLSRRVHPMKLHTRVMDRSLLACYEKLR